jgi:GNAT superfamily N-acetyltransferase
VASSSPDEAQWTVRTQANEYLVKFDFEPEPQEDEYDDYDDYERAYYNAGMNTAFYARDKNGQWTMDITNVGEKELTQIIATVARLLAEFLKQHKHLRYIGISGKDRRRHQIYQRLIQQNLQKYFPGQDFAIDQGGIRRVIKEFAPSPERDHNDDVPDPIFVLANRWWNATDRQPQIEHVLNSLGWSIHQVESEDDGVQLQHRDGTTHYISADDFDPDLFEYQEPGIQRANRDGIDLSFEKIKDDEYVNDDDDENIVAQVTATSHGKELGHVLFSIDGNTLLPQDLEVDERYRGQGIAKIMYDYVKSLGYQIRRSGQQTDAGAGFWSKHRPAQNVWESQEFPTKDMIAYLRKHHDTNLHQDYLDHINTFSKFVLQNIPVNTIKTELSGLDRAKVEQYKKMDFSKAPPIVMGDGNILDGYHRANVAKALGIPTIRAYVGVKGVAEGKITLSTDPNWYGATVDNYQATGPVVNIPANQLVGFEPDAKMNQPKSKANVEKIVAGLKQGAKLPPLLIRKYKNGYQVLDGHHRFWAYKLLGVKSIPAQIVPDSDIEEISKQGVAENFNDGKKPGRKGLAKRSGVNCKQSVSKLRSIAAHSTGERQRMAHWCANMKSGKKK